jgi:hypothetical protein
MRESHTEKKRKSHAAEILTCPRQVLVEYSQKNMDASWG